MSLQRWLVVVATALLVGGVVGWVAAGYAGGSVTMCVDRADGQSYCATESNRRWSVGAPIGAAAALCFLAGAIRTMRSDEDDDDPTGRGA